MITRDVKEHILDNDEIVNLIVQHLRENNVRANHENIRIGYSPDGMEIRAVARVEINDREVW